MRLSRREKFLIFSIIPVSLVLAVLALNLGRRTHFYFPSPLFIKNQNSEVESLAQRVKLAKQTYERSAEAIKVFKQIIDQVYIENSPQEIGLQVVQDIEKLANKEKVNILTISYTPMITTEDNMKFVSLDTRVKGLPQNITKFVLVELCGSKIYKIVSIVLVPSRDNTDVTADVRIKAPIINGM